MLEKSFSDLKNLFVEPEQLRNGVDLVVQDAETVQDKSIPAAQLPACSMGTDLRASTIVCHHFGSSLFRTVVRLNCLQNVVSGCMSYNMYI